MFGCQGPANIVLRMHMLAPEVASVREISMCSCKQSIHYLCHASSSTAVPQCPVSRDMAGSHLAPAHSVHFNFERAFKSPCRMRTHRVKSLSVRQS